MSENGYATLEALEQLASVRDYRDVSVTYRGQAYKFRIQTLSESEWADISSGNIDVKRGGLSADGLRRSDSNLVAACLVDGDGNRIYRGRDAADRVGNLPAALVEPLVRACRDINGLRSAEDEGKNSPDGSGSDGSCADTIRQDAS